MLQLTLYTLAFIGAVGCLYFVAWPIIWCGLYATGLLIFQLRTAGPEWKQRSWASRFKQAVGQWGSNYGQAVSWPASSVSRGQTTWKPFFNYEGFKSTKATPSATSNSADEDDQDYANAEIELPPRSPD